MRRCIFRQLRAPLSPRPLGHHPQLLSFRIGQRSRSFSQTPRRYRRINAPLERIRDKLAVSDLQGASEAHDELLRQGGESQEDVETLSKLLQALCLSEGEHEAKIRQLLGEFRDRGLHADGNTTAALIYRNLTDGWNGDVEEALEKDVVKFSNEDKRTVVDAFKRHIISSKTSTTAAWEAYLQLRSHLADSIPIETGEALVETFFARKRADMACAVLSHFSTGSNTSPSQKTFLVALDGIAKSADEESLKVVHNLLKVSIYIEPNTELSNALMRAYAACYQYLAVWEIWNDVADSLEGPDYETIVIALQACSYIHKGYGKALSIMERLKLADVPVNDGVIGAYAGVLVRQDRFEEGLRAVEKWKGNFTGEIGVAMCTPVQQDARNDITEWIKEKYPAALPNFEAGLAALEDRERQTMTRMFFGDQDQEQLD